jgi:hypothetical protein
MGDRALIVFHGGKQHSPVIYLHWGGYEVVGLLKKTRALMNDRLGDVEYTAARFCGICHEDTDGNTSLGMWNSPKDIEELKASNYSHGDAGVILVDVSDSTWIAKAYNGYGLKVDEKFHEELAIGNG